MAVEGAVGQVEHAHAIEPPLFAQTEQRFLDRLKRHRAVHRVLGKRERFDVKRLAADKHQSVVMRFVAIAVDDHDVAWSHQCLHNHLVACRSAVRHKEYVIRAERARGHLLCLLDVPGRLQKAVQPTGRGAAFRQEQVQAVEFAHVANPFGDLNTDLPRAIGRAWKVPIGRCA